MRYSADRVLAVAVSLTGLTFADLFGKVHPRPSRRGTALVRSRRHELLIDRAYVIYAVREIGGVSFPEIARAIGDDSHSSTHAMYRRAMRKYSPTDVRRFHDQVLARLRIDDERIADRLATGVVGGQG